MPRKKKPAAEAAPVEATTAIVVAEPQSQPQPRREVPAWVDGPQFVADVPAEGPSNPEAKNWGPPYKAIVTTPTFEMGENRRFKQRVFKFKERPADDVLAALKQRGFTYRGEEKAWTIPANPETRKLTDELARELAGPAAGIVR